MEQIASWMEEALRTSTIRLTEQLDEELARRDRDAIEEPALPRARPDGPVADLRRSRNAPVEPERLARPTTLLLQPGGQRRVTGLPAVPTAIVAPNRCPRSDAMNGHVYGLSEIVGTSAQGVDDAIRVGIQRAARTVRGLDWFEVTDIRGHLADGEIEHFQVTLKIGFRMEDPKQA